MENMKKLFFISIFFNRISNFFIFIPWAAWDAALSAGIIPSSSWNDKFHNVYFPITTWKLMHFFHLRMWVVEIFSLQSHPTHITVACEKWLRKILQQWFNLYVKASHTMILRRKTIFSHLNVISPLCI